MSKKVESILRWAIVTAVDGPVSKDYTPWDFKLACQRHQSVIDVADDALEIIIKDEREEYVSAIVAYIRKGEGVDTVAVDAALCHMAEQDEL